MLKTSNTRLMYKLLIGTDFSLHNLLESFGERGRALSERIKELMQNKHVQFLGLMLPNGNIELKKGDPHTCPFLPEGQGPFAPKGA